MRDKGETDSGHMAVTKMTKRKNTLILSANWTQLVILWRETSLNWGGGTKIKNEKSIYGVQTKRGKTFLLLCHFIKPQILLQNEIALHSGTFSEKQSTINENKHKVERIVKE